jgi:predicted DNA-binding protein
MYDKIYIIMEDFKMTIRKNFLLDDETVEHLKKIAKEANTTQTQVIRNLIEEKYQEVSVKEKLEALDRIVGSCNGLFIGKSIQSIKANMDV